MHLCTCSPVHIVPIPMTRDFDVHSVRAVIKYVEANFSDDEPDGTVVVVDSRTLQ